MESPESMERWGRSQSDRVALGVAYGLRKCVRSICGYWLRVWEISIRGEKSKLDVASIRGNDNVNTHSAPGVRGVSNGSGSIASLMQDSFCCAGSAPADQPRLRHDFSDNASQDCGRGRLPLRSIVSSW